MKRGEIKRKAPMVRGTNQLSRTAMKPATKKIKSQGMAGSRRTAADISFHDAIASLGCIACRIDGRENMEVSIHHIDGRTKEGAHRMVLPLCANHHQHGTGNDKTAIAVHPYKKSFENKYGSQFALLAICLKMLLDKQCPSHQDDQSESRQN